MIYEVKVITRANQNKVIEEGYKQLKIYLVAVPEKGKANKLLLKVLAEHFKVKNSEVKLLVGKTSHKKLIEIDL